MKLTRIVYGLTALQESDIFAGGDPQKDWPIDLAFFLLQGKGRRILVDCGCDTMPGFVLSAFIGPVKALQSQGVLPEQITDVILTHRHHDHAAGLCHFPNATVYIQQEEASRCQKYLLPSQKVVVFDRELTVAEGVKAVKIGGHTDGSCVVEVGNTVLCGDECYSSYNLAHKLPTASCKNPENSQAFIDRYAEGWTALLCHDPKTKECYL